MAGVKKKKITVVGLTGGYGTGKTTVAGMFERLGAVVLDADRLAHKAYKKGSHSYLKIIRVFGKDVLGPSGDIDRRKLGKLVFCDRRSLKSLCRIVHPVVIRDILRSIKKMSSSHPGGTIVIDAPLLIESGLHATADHLVVVKAPRTEQIKRLIRKTGTSKSEIAKRINSQMPLRLKVRLADYVIDNGGRLSETLKAVKKIWREIKK